jgi:hypothetical protein
MERAQGIAVQPSISYTAGIANWNLVMVVYPQATVTVVYTGTSQLAPLYMDNQTTPTPLANPFSASVNGYWFFYAANGRYDISMVGTGLNITIADVLLNDPADV